MAEVLEEGTFDVADYADELAAAPTNLDVGTALLYENDRVKGVGVTILLMNPANPYHWVSIRPAVDREVHEDDPVDGHLATETIDAAWTKYAGNSAPYGLRDPSKEERRVMFACKVERVAVFGKP